MKHLNNITSENCSGCSACKAACPNHAITLVKDDEGFLIPKIDINKCTDCGFCTNVCQNNVAVRSEEKYEDLHYSFAVHHKDDNIRKNSSSGAFFQAVAESFIDRGGYVCGCVLEGMKVIHIVSDRIEDVRRMADSKYVQSDVRNCFAEIRDLLKQQKSVLFSGTSCQTAGLKIFLKKSSVNIDNLLCIDFICHGTPSHLIWDEYLKFYEKKTHRKPMSFRWRCKEFGWGKASLGTDYLNTILCENNKKDQSQLARIWSAIYFSHLVIRRKCHKCDYCTVDKPGDITMADFWKIEEIVPEFSDGKGSSLVIVHNVNHLKYVTENLNLVTLSVDLTNALKGQTHTYRPTEPNENRTQFWKDYSEKGFDYVFYKYFYTKKLVIKRGIKWILFKLGICEL